MKNEKEIEELRDKYLREFKNTKEELDREIEKFKEMINSGADENSVLLQKLKLYSLINRMIYQPFAYFMRVTDEMWNELMEVSEK